MISKEERSIMEFDKDKLTITLDDNSKWLIHIADIRKVKFWVPTDRILIDETDDGIYHYKLINLDTVEPNVIRALRII